MKQFYLPYDEKSEINYCYVLMFYIAASYNKQSKKYDTISYSTIDNLTEKLNAALEKDDKKISSSTVKRILSNPAYNTFLEIDKENKIIGIKNNIKSCNKFVVLSELEALLVIRSRDNLLANYLLFLKYYCGYSKSNKINTTAKQFLDACGYSSNSNAYISKVSEYNRLFVENGFIKIEKYRDDNGNERNFYSCK